MVHVPDDILALIDDADGACRRHRRERGEGRDSFIAADPVAVLHALVGLDDRGGRFLEWGSGLGTVTLIAARLGFDAYGIEVDDRLVDAARDLAERHDIEATFAVGTFIPAGVEPDPSLHEANLYHRVAAADGYDELGLALADFDLVYVYPWTQEVSFFRRLFLAGAQPGARLLINLGDDGFSLVRR